MPYACSGSFHWVLVSAILGLPSQAAFWIPSVRRLAEGSPCVYQPFAVLNTSTYEELRIKY